MFRIDVLRTVGLITGACFFPGGVGADETFTYFDEVFLPTAVTITAGDTVHWQWAAGSHTATSGESSAPEHNPGELFDVVQNCPRACQARRRVRFNRRRGLAPR